MTVEQSIKPKRWEQFASFFKVSESAKPNLRDRWKYLLTRKQSANKEQLLEDRVRPEALFGVPLHISTKYASTVVNLGRNGGYLNCLVPIVIAECGAFLKSNGANTKGIFRINGSSRRVSQLQEIFNTGPTFGLDISWEDYTVHDVANLFRRYLNCLPEPVISPHLYFLFRKAYNDHQDNDEVRVIALQSLLPYLPRPNQILLLYLVNLLAYFGEHKETTLMDTGNLATIFQPCILAHPSHTLQPEEYRYSSLIVEDLIHHSNRLKVPPYHGIPLPPQPIIEYDYSQKPTKAKKIEIKQNPLPKPPLNHLVRSLSVGKRKYSRKHGLTRSDSQNFLQKAQEPSDTYQPPSSRNVKRSATLPGKQRKRMVEY
ncbi:GTPase activating protein (GAP) for Rho1p [Basidiobolus ranarum]|uniref:GTPase activating protein (GAP) for Rho1p n=1 Tax=Basidiobolus ranarum TaxID=34480 RepID=A0ABR2W0H2_9FUNG